MKATLTKLKIGLTYLAPIAPILFGSYMVLVGSLCLVGLVIWLVRIGWIGLVAGLIWSIVLVGLIWLVLIYIMANRHTKSVQMFGVQNSHAIGSGMESDGLKLRTYCFDQAHRVDDLTAGWVIHMKAKRQFVIVHNDDQWPKRSDAERNEAVSWDEIAAVVLTVCAPNDRYKDRFESTKVKRVIKHTIDAPTISGRMVLFGLRLLKVLVVWHQGRINRGKI